MGVGLGRGLVLSDSLPHVSWNLLGLWGREMGNDFFVGQMKLARTERDPQKQALKSNSCLHQS